ncbi:hypothetical protein L6452_20356 [Arctium lappa]|uniref:Uncharacterized protein n=1 Tax=Arctium lappa TaxID=4217 RepID=A0ACB9BBP3_ARCLA|nr:hypothetical protein L6452_20356 [Arctium lappa]
MVLLVVLFFYSYQFRKKKRNQTRQLNPKKKNKALKIEESRDLFTTCGEIIVYKAVVGGGGDGGGVARIYTPHAKHREKIGGKKLDSSRV